MSGRDSYKSLLPHESRMIHAARLKPERTSRSEVGEHPNPGEEGTPTPETTSVRAG